MMALLGIILISCKEELTNRDFILDAPVEIQGFTLDGQEGEIDQQSGQIHFTLPYHSPISASIPDAVLPVGASISPELGEVTDFSNKRSFRVINGNRYKDYSVTAKVLPPILDFSINGITGEINDQDKTLQVTLPPEMDVSNAEASILASEGVTISPDINAISDFTSPVAITITALDGYQVNYEIKVFSASDEPIMAFLGTADRKGDIVDPDERAAAEWFFDRYSNSEYLSFESIKSGKSLDNYAAIWWHLDASMELPQIALDAEVITSLKAYHNHGGELLLTTFASRYLEALGIIPMGKGPNNVFGDFPPNGFIDSNNSWGICFKGHESHPLFQGLQTYENGKAYFLEKGTFRLNHTAWWFLPEWGGYNDGAGWRDQTGGINLASEGWDDALNGRVLIAEFPKQNGTGNTIVISFGAYDWYQEATSDGTPSQANGFLGNVKQLTRNALDYLSK